MFGMSKKNVDQNWKKKKKKGVGGNLVEVNDIIFSSDFYIIL